MRGNSQKTRLSAGLTAGHRLRRWPAVKPALRACTESARNPEADLEARLQTDHDGLIHVLQGSACPASLPDTHITSPFIPPPPPDTAGPELESSARDP